MDQSKLNDGGPAMPSIEFDQSQGHWEGRYEIHRQHAGMSLRDYFAAAAIQSVSCGIIADANHGTTEASLAHAAYGIADAMLAARNQQPAEDEVKAELLAACMESQNVLAQLIDPNQQASSSKIVWQQATIADSKCRAAIAKANGGAA